MDKKTLFAIIISFILLITAIVFNRFTFKRMKAFTEGVDQTQEVIMAFENLSNHLKSAQIYTPTYAGIPENDYYELYKKEADSIPHILVTLQGLLHDNLNQAKLVDSIAIKINNQLPSLMQYNVAELIIKKEAWRLDELFAIHRMINTGIENEKELLALRYKELQESTRQNNLMVISFALIAIIIIVTTFFSIFFISKRRKWLEGFLESILNTSRDVIIHYKPVRENNEIVDFEIEYANRAAAGMFKVPESDLFGRSVSELSSQIRQVDLLDKLTYAVETGHPEKFEMQVQHGKEMIWVYASLSKTDGGITGNFHDITPLKKYEEELKTNITQLQRSNQELEQYAYVASHDLQEPLRKIRSFGSYLFETQADKLDEKGKQQLNKMIQAAERMSILIKDILTFSSLKKDDHYQPVDLNTTIEYVTNDLDLAINQKHAMIKSDKLPTIEAIPLQMNQLFYNLINNALKFAKKDVPPTIRITSRLIPEYEKQKYDGLLIPGPYYEINFSDNGIGFNQDYADQIFGLFKRLNDKQFYPGSGIGLTLCKKVVENHNGIIQAESKENEGATFHILLPKDQSKGSEKIVQ